MVTDYAQLNVKQLQQEAKALKIPGWHKMNRDALIVALEYPGMRPKPVLELNPSSPTPTPDPLDIPDFLKVTPEEAAKRKAARDKLPFEAPAFAITKAGEESKASATQGKRECAKKRIIRLVTLANPKKPGTSAHERYKLYKDGMTVGEFLAAGGTSGDLSWDTGRGYIKLENGGE